MKMTMEMKTLIAKIANLKESDVGSTEENVKQKIIVPLLELLGHKREDLEFEYRTKSGKGKIDIFIRNVPTDCKVIIDTKNYTENLSDHIEQVKEYTFEQAALLAVIANGTEIRIYSPLRGVDFERSLLFSIKRENLSKEKVWFTLSSLLHKDNLQDRSVIAAIEEREREIKETISKEERLKQDFNDKINDIDADIVTKEEEIEQLKKRKEGLIEQLEGEIAKIWISIDLPSDLLRIPSPLLSEGTPRVRRSTGYPWKAGRVTLQELVDIGLVKDGETLYFYHTRLFENEQAQIIASSNKLKYRTDGRIYSVSDLAKILLIKHGFKRDEHGVAGPRYWKTKDEELLDNLNDKVRRKRGDRK